MKKFLLCVCAVLMLINLSVVSALSKSSTSVSGVQVISIYDIPDGTMLPRWNGDLVEFDIDDNFDRYYPYYTLDYSTGAYSYDIYDIFGERHEFIVLDDGTEELPKTTITLLPEMRKTIENSNVWKEYNQDDFTYEITVGKYFRLPETSPFEEKYGYNFTGKWISSEGDIYDAGENVRVPLTPAEGLDFYPEWHIPIIVGEYDLYGHWAQEAVRYMVDWGYIEQPYDNIFLPNEEMDRYTFVKALARYSKVETDPMHWAIDIGLLQGYGNGDYGLFDTITREQMAVFFERYLTLMNYDISSMKVKERTTFADDATIADWAKGSVYTMQEMTLIQGKGNGIFDPKGLTTRAEGATVIYNLIQAIE